MARTVGLVTSARSTVSADAGFDLVSALAGAVLLRDRLAEAGDGEGTYLALVTVDALNRVAGELGLVPSGRATLVERSGGPPVPQFVDG
jgi:hypothetical protein